MDIVQVFCHLCPGSLTNLQYKSMTPWWQWDLNMLQTAAWFRLGSKFKPF